MLLNNAALGFPRVIREMIGGAPLSSRWYAPTWSVAGGVLLNTPSLGAELLTDGELENWNSATDLTSWTEQLAGGSTVNREAAVVSAGTYSARFDVDGSNSSVRIYQLTTLASIEPFMRILFSIRASAGGKTGYAGYGNALSPSPDPGAAWQNVVWTTRPLNAGSGVSQYLSLWRFSAASASLYFDAVSVKQAILSTLFASINSRLANCNLIAPPISTFQTVTQAGIVLRLDSPTNPQNFVIAYCDGNGYVKIEKCVNGTYTTLSTVAAAYGATKYFSAKMNGSSISIYYGTTNFGTLIATVTVSDATVVNNTRHGLFSTYSGNQFAGTFSVVPYA
jgi:hypothetical protein